MKKYIVALLAVIMLLCAGCGKQQPAAPAEPETTAAETTVPEAIVPEETVPVPQLEMASALADNTPAVLTTLSRGDTVDVVGEYDENHMVIKTDDGYGLVKKNLLRSADEAAYEEWTAYASYNAEIYDNLHLTGNPAKQLSSNTKVTILDDLTDCYLVQTEGMTGFVRKNRVNKWPIASSGGGGGGSIDGGDISLRYRGGVFRLAAIAQEGTVTGKATVLADGTEVILGYFNRGEKIPVVAEQGFAEDKEGFVTVYLDGLYTYVPQVLVVKADAEGYEAWEGYSSWNGTLFDNHYLTGEPAAILHTNDKVCVVAELDNCYLVESGGTAGFMPKEKVSKFRYATGGGGSGSGGGGGGDWTPPAL